MTDPPHTAWALTTIVATTLVVYKFTAGQRDTKQLTEFSSNLQIGD